MLATRGWLKALVVLTGASPLSAQDSPLVRLMGEVRDVANELPIEGAAVKILELDRAAMADRNGFFVFDSLPSGTWTFETSQFGFRTNTESSTIAARSFLLVRLEAAPIELEGLYVSVVEGLVERRLAVPSRVVAWEKEDLSSAIAADIGSFVRRRGVVPFVTCGGEFSVNDLPNCFLHRGLVKRLRIFLDDIEVPSAIGTTNLWAMDPRDLWSVEFIPSCAELRLYTQDFMRRVESGQVRLAPALCVP